MASEAFSTGNELYVDEEYPEALQAYNQAVEALDGQTDEPAKVLKVKVLVKRAAVHLKLKDQESALDDANAAIRLNPESVDAYYRKGEACFALEEYETAKAAFEKAVSCAPTGHSKLASYKKWIRKCDAEMDSDDEDITAAVAAVESNSAAPAAAAAPAPAPSAAPASAPSKPPAQKRAPATQASRVKHDWYESSGAVNIDILSKTIDQSKSSIDFTDDSVDVLLAMQDGSSYALNLELADHIVPDKCSVKFKSMKAELKLIKKTHREWGMLERQETLPVANDDEEDLPTVDTLPPAYAGKRTDWNAIEKEQAKEEEEENTNGDKALQTLFQSIYKNASEETRRAMIKSYQTSGGTVLSTNWDEVKTKDYEAEDRVAPEGMQWKKWG